ncbi:MAG: hypothetical protein ACREX0_10710, partial [Noviherbaspirillum sp.]
RHPHMASVEGPRIKLARASRHIAELGKLASQYLASKPFSIYSTEEQNGDLVWRVRMERPVPLEWSAIVGDAVHNIRSALDLLAWQLVEASGSQPSRDTCFPIGQAATPPFEVALRRALQGLSPKALRFVRRLRPYGGGNRVLSQLHALDIVDKHRLVLVVGAANKQLVIKVKMKVPWADQPIEAQYMGSDSISFMSSLKII